MIKEILFVKNNDFIETVHVGCFPSKGRYFRKKLENDGFGVFRTKIEINCSEIFTHFFINNDFSQPYNNNSDGRISQNDPLKRSLHKFTTAPFCAVKFENRERFIFPVSSNQWEVHAISYYSWIQSLLLVTASLEEIPFSVFYRYKNRKYWRLRVMQDKLPETFAIKIRGKNRVFFLHRDNLLSKTPNPDRFFSFPCKKNSGLTKERAILPHYTGYQVFPDRFCKYSSSGKEKYSLQKWGEKPGIHSYFGGDIKGIISKLPYLKDLGIDFLYLNPVFFAKSSHRYDTIDYFKVDPLLGDESDLKELVEQAHRLQIKIILDIPLNHSGVDFFAFKDILKKQEKSEYCDWFNIHLFPVKVNAAPTYDAWCGIGSLPEFNLNNPVVREYLVGAALYWHKKCDIDGWRLDSISYLPMDFITHFETSVRKARKDAIIIGEFWHNNAYELMEESGIDGVTDYSFYWQVFVPLFEWNALPLSKIMENFVSLCYANPGQKGLHCWNFLSNHDIVRFNSGIANDRKYELAVVLMYALPGNPIIYYGEEIGLPGMNDPDNRRCMEWKSGNRDSMFYILFKSLNHLRKKYKFLFEENNIAVSYVSQRKQILVIKRFTGSQSLYFIFNFSSQIRNIFLDKAIKKGDFTDVLAGVKQEPVCKLAGSGYKILSMTEDNLQDL